MASKEAEEEGLCNTGTEEETIAWQKKRSRRVSFAETTAIHLFLRDEEYETPPDAANPSSEVGDSSNGRLLRSDSEEIMEMLLSGDDSDGNRGGCDDDDDDDDMVAVKSSFIRPMESPSSGSVFGSATSIDGENFFGPVSTDFIKPGRLSDSGVSDENHDVTMDSTAFSMHFRSLARSDSGGEFKTPTGIRLAFDETTPGQISNSTSFGDMMVLTAARKPVLHSSLLTDKVNDSGHSDDMSLVRDNPHRYDYGKLPPELDVLLAEGGENVGAVSHVECSNSVSSLKKETLDQNRCVLLDPKHNKNVDIYHVTDMIKTYPEAISKVHTNTDKGKDSDNLDSVDDDLVNMTSAGNQFKAPFHQANGLPLDKDVEARKEAMDTDGKFKSPPSTTQSNLNPEQSTRSSFAGSISSLLAKRRQIFKDPISSSNDQSNSISLAENLYNKESIKHVLSTSSFTKYVSRLKRIEAFPFSSTSKAEVNASRLLPPRSFTRSLDKEKFVGSISNDISINHVDAPIARLETRFSNVAEEDGGFKSISKMDSVDLLSVGDTKHASYAEEVKYVELSAKSMGVMVSPSFTASQKNGLDYHVLKDIPINGTLESKNSESSLPEITLIDMHAGTPDHSIYSSENREMKVSSMNKQRESGLRLDRDITQNDAGNLVSRTENSSSSFLKRMEKTNMTSPDIRHFKDVFQESQMQNEEPMHRNPYGSPVTSIFIQTASMDEACESRELSSSSYDIQTGSRPSRSTKGLPVQSMKSVARSTASSDRPNDLPLQVSESPKADLSYSLLKKEPCDLADDANVTLFVEKDVATSRPNQITRKYDKKDQFLQKPSHVCGSDNFSSLKRKYGELFDKAEDHTAEIPSFQRSPKTHKGQIYCEEGSEISHSRGRETTLRHWTDVFTGFCGVTKQLLSPLTDKLDFTQIGILEDILIHLEKMKSYELLHWDICSQKSFDPACFLQNKRLVDTKMLLYRTVCEKAKLQLIHLKRDKLLEHVRQLNSKVQESEMLMSSCRQSGVNGQKYIQFDSFQSESCHTDIENKSLVDVEISSLRKELEVSDRKIKNLKESFQTHFKVMEEPTVYVKDFLKKRAACRSLQSELQLCEVESLETMNGQWNILFDHGFMLQRFSVISNSTFGVTISNKLNNLKISKMFLKMDASTAFSFVLCGETTPSYAGLRTIAQETQKTSLLLQNLLDVVEEVELAMLELRNLTHARFCKPSAGKLDLQLSFSDFKSGARVTLTIDITCLNRGIYPSEVLPYEVQGRAARKHGSFELLLSNIRSAVGGLRCGYMRILSLCRCVSKMIQASNSMSQGKY